MSYEQRIRECFPWASMARDAACSIATEADATVAKLRVALRDIADYPENDAQEMRRMALEATTTTQALEDAEDAARYRLLRERNAIDWAELPPDVCVGLDWSASAFEASVDAAIDAARSKT